MVTGADTGPDRVRVGMAVLTVRDQVTGTATGVIAIIAMAIVVITTDGGIRSLHSALAQSLVVQSPLRRLPQSTAHLLIVTAIRTTRAPIPVTGPTGPLTIRSSRITAPVSSVTHPTNEENSLNSTKPLSLGGFVSFTDAAWCILEWLSFVPVHLKRRSGAGIRDALVESLSPFCSRASKET